MGLARVDKSNPDACPKVALFNKGYLTQDFSKPLKLKIMLKFFGFHAMIFGNFPIEV